MYRCYVRLYLTTASETLQGNKNFFQHCVDNNWIDADIIYSDENLFILKDRIDFKTTIYTIHYLYARKYIESYICDAFCKYVGIDINKLDQFKSFLKEEVVQDPKNIRRGYVNDYYSNCFEFCPTNKREQTEVLERWMSR